MMLKPPHRLLAMGILLSILCAFSLLPRNLFSIQEKPTPEPQMIYDYYIIIDEIDDHSLMYVPLVVNIGDEILTEGNKLYKVVRIEQNRAFARFVEDVKLDDYQKTLR